MLAKLERRDGKLFVEIPASIEKLYSLKPEMIFNIRVKGKNDSIVINLALQKPLKN